MISIIIPTYNEEIHIRKTIQNLWNHDERHLIGEIIIVDAGSADNTVPIANSEGAKTIICPNKGRAAQMNYGASSAIEEILYFLHADTIPPQNFTGNITEAVAQHYEAGCYRLTFDHDHWFLKANSWFTRFDINAVRFGDQSLFVSKEVFHKSGGFRADLLVMEDQEIIHRIKRHGRFKVLNDTVITSARKYLDNGVYRMQGIFYRIWVLYYLGYSQEHLLKLHRRLIRKHKL